MSEGTPAGIPQDRQVPVVWVGADDAPVLFANQVQGQIGPQGEIVLTFGQLIPPSILGTPEQMAEQAGQITQVQTKTLARIIITRTGLDQLIELLEKTVVNFERAEEMLRQLQSETGDEK